MSNPSIPVVLPDLLPGTPHPTLAVLDPQAAAGWLTLAEESAALTVTDATSQAAAEKALVGLHNAAKTIEDRRKALKRPITDLGKAIEACVSSVANPVTKAKQALQGKISDFLMAERAKAEEAAAAERKRLEEEARIQAEKDATELAEIIGAPVEPDQVKVVVPVAAPVAAAPVSSAITMRSVTKLVIDDPAAVPCVVGGVDIRPINMAAVRRLLDAGVDVPGARLVTEEVAAMKRGAGF